MDTSALREQTSKAVNALLKWHERKAAESDASLFGDEEMMLTVFSLKKCPDTSSSKPIPIEVPHPVRDPKTLSICIIIKDEEKDDLKEKLKAFADEGVKKVIKLKKLRLNYRQYADQRTLLKRHDIFMCDERIMPSLATVLSKKFFDNKKQPIPIRVVGDAKKEIIKARDCTYMFKSSGPCRVVKTASTLLPPEAIVDNAMAVIEGVIAHTPKKFDGIQSISLKTTTSTALPVYQSAVPLKK